jgi:hypothetical protein
VSSREVPYCTHEEDTVKAYTFHLDFTAEDSTDAVRLSDMFHVVIANYCATTGDPAPTGWDVSGTDDDCGQDPAPRDWSIIIPRHYDRSPGCE